MKTRLTLLTAFSLVFLFLSLISIFSNYSSPPLVLVSLPFIICVAVIFYYITSDAEFNMAGHVLIITKPLSGKQEKHDLTQVRQWEETGYNLRGKRRKNLTIVFETSKVELSNRDHEENYEKVFTYLRKEFPLIEKFNMTPLQEIKFEAVHEFLATDFYNIGDKRTHINDDKSRRLSIEVFRLKLEGANRERIAEVLLKIKTKGLGTHETFANCERIADLVLEM